MRQQERQNRGRKNWTKLKNIVLSGTLAAKTRQRKLQLFQRHTQHFQNHVLTSLATNAYTLLQKSPLPLYKQLLHFEGAVDTTGRWVWEAEEVAAYFFLQKGEAVIADAVMRGDGKSGKVRILELGAGSSGLAGVALWRIASELKGVRPELLLTDGEADNISFLQDNITLNNLPAQSCTANLLLWGQIASISNLSLPMQERTVFQVIIICDCLYFQAFHKELLLTIDSYLSPHGCVYLVNPSRGHSMKAFLILAAERGFQWEQLTFSDEKYQMQLASARMESGFDEDKHSFFFTKLCRK